MGFGAFQSRDVGHNDYTVYTHPGIYYGWFYMDIYMALWLRHDCTVYSMVVELMMYIYIQHVELCKS